MKEEESLIDLFHGISIFSPLNYDTVSKQGGSMNKTAKLTYNGKDYELPLIIGTEKEVGIDIRKLRAESGAVTFDDGFGNTASCQSTITYIDGEKGILRYRGYAIEELAKNYRFLAVAHLILHGFLPSDEQLNAFRFDVHRNCTLHTGMEHHFQAFPQDSHPMAILSSLLNALGCYYPQMTSNNHISDLEHYEEAATLLLSKVRLLAAMTYRAKMGLPFVYPKRSLPYSANFLHMMFSQHYEDYIPTPEVIEALDLFLLLHADHEQNCSTSTVRMVASGGANLFASVSAGVSALWGPSHGGANMAVIDMLEAIERDGDDGTRFIDAAKRGEARLMGFGHRVYKNYDPRAKILGKAAEKVFAQMGKLDKKLDIARRLEELALTDPYFIERKLYPNVDFYSGIILSAIGIPTNMFTVMFAMGRLPGWIAHWKEVASNPKTKIYRPRQIYMGEPARDLP